MEDINIKRIREYLKDFIHKECASMKILDMNYSMLLENIYVDIDVFRKISSKRRISPDQLLQGLNLNNIWGSTSNNRNRVSAFGVIEEQDNIIFLGKPGSGKTILLKQLAKECIEGNICKNLIPIYISLRKYFSDDLSFKYKKHNLFSIINEYFSLINLDNSKTLASDLLKSGNALILLDGFDEVSRAQKTYVFDLISNFIKEYNDNKIVMTSRINAYTRNINSFIELEIADFNPKQISCFSKKWFAIRRPNKSNIQPRFLHELKSNKQIFKLASNPLLLTLLCLIFEELRTFPDNKSGLYKEGLEILLRKWDAERDVERPTIYEGLSIGRKKDLLSYVATMTFERGEFFIKKDNLEKYIAVYISNLSVSRNADMWTRDISDSEINNTSLEEGIIREIEVQHGIFIEQGMYVYSFSHFTFHEYFTARKIAYSQYNSDHRKHIRFIFNRRWHDIFLMVFELMPNSDDFLKSMKNYVDMYIKQQRLRYTKINEFLNWIEEKSTSVPIDFRPSAIRAFYFSRALELDLDVAQSLALDKSKIPFSALARALDRAQELTLELTLMLARSINLATNREECHIILNDLLLNIYSTINKCSTDALLSSLKSLVFELPIDESTLEIASKGNDIDLFSIDYMVFKEWWRENGYEWTKKLRGIMNEFRNIGYEWKFTNEEMGVLENYYYSYRLMLNCIQSDCYISNTVKSKVLDEAFALNQYYE